jgi:hypothetical protein
VEERSDRALDGAEGGWGGLPRRLLISQRILHQQRPFPQLSSTCPYIFILSSSQLDQTRWKRDRRFVNAATNLPLARPCPRHTRRLEGPLLFHFVIFSHFFLLKRFEAISLVPFSCQRP